jgi:hypothetical protein
MSSSRNLILLICTGFSLLLGLTLLGLHLQNDRVEAEAVKAQTDLLRIQEELNRGELSRRVLQNVVQDLTATAGQKPEVQYIMTRYGVSIRKPAGNN